MDQSSIQISLSVFETIITCGLLVVRLMNTRDKYAELRAFRNDIEHVHEDDPDLDLDSHPEGGALRIWVNTCYISGAVLVIFDLL